MATLLYHSDSDSESPFDSAILRVARSGPVRIVSPYIGVTYLQRIVSTQPEWRLLSDVEEWLRALSARDRPKAWAFIRANLEQIHHVPSLHAKSVIGDSLAMMGSANLTQRGILGRTELGVLVDDPVMVAELCTWFDGIWSTTAPPSVDEASAFVQWLDEEAAQAPAKRQRFSLSSDSRKVRARLVKLEVPKPAENSPLDLGVVAQAVIVEDQRHYDSLEAAMEAAVDKLTARGRFTFGQVAAETRRGFAASNLREVYFLLVQHCANHPRSALAAETQNRLILTDGLFLQSTKDALPRALEPFDAFLALLVTYLTFEQPAALPSFADIERETGFGDRDQSILVSELVDAGFLIEEDRSGELPWYQLDGAFDGWERRFKLFPRAHASWDAKRRRQSHQGRLMVACNEDEIEPPIRTRGVLRDDQLPEVDDSGEDIDFAGLEKEIAAGAATHPRLATSEAIQAAKRKHKQQLKDAARTPAEFPLPPLPRKATPVIQSLPEVTRGEADTFLAKLLTAVAGGQAFTAPDWHALTAKVAQETQSPEGVTRIALNPIYKHPQVFLVAVRGNGVEIQVNPLLKWDMLIRYPKTRAACEQLLGA